MKIGHLICTVFFLGYFLNCKAELPASNITGDDNKYDIKKIPASLLKDADAVIRADIGRLEIKNRSRSVEKVKWAVTIFKKEGQHHGGIFLTYGKFNEIKNLEGKVFDADGKVIRELDDNQIGDFILRSEYASFKDSRAKSAYLDYYQFPYTVEFTYENVRSQSLNWPEWTSQGTLDPVELSRFEVIAHVEDSIRYWCSNDTVKPVINADGNKREYVWEFKNLPKLSKDIVGEDAEDWATNVKIAPSSFEVEDYSGNMRSWKDFGLWDYALIKDRDKLPDTLRQSIRSLIKPTDSVYEKIRKLYQYMQDRTRYVNISLGIGSWQPFDATFVHEHGYGDCKALSNYMMTLLKEAGIASNTVLIYPGRHRFPFIEDFPSNQFSHVIVCVPLKPDTVWLECTDQSAPFGHLSSKTENRGALLISSEGGVVVHTPRSTPQQNKQQQQAHVILNPFGNANSNVLIVKTGDQQDFTRGALYDATPKEREQWLINQLGIPNVSLTNYKLEGLETHELEVRLSLQIEIMKYGSVSGNRLFFCPNLMEKQTYTPPQISKRLSPIDFEYPHFDADSIYYSLPKGFTIESTPKEAHFKTSFGEFYSKTVALGDTAIIYKRSMEIREYSIPAEKYTEYRQFFSDIAKADRVQVVLKRADW